MTNEQLKKSNYLEWLRAFFDGQNFAVWLELSRMEPILDEIVLDKDFRPLEVSCFFTKNP